MTSASASNQITFRALWTLPVAVTKQAEYISL